jgi:hypothetical protein
MIGMFVDSHQPILTRRPEMLIGNDFDKEQETGERPQ